MSLKGSRLQETEGNGFQLQVAAEDASEVQRLAKEIAAAEKELLPLQKKLAPLQQKAEALEGKIEGAGGAPLKKQKEAVAGLQQVNPAMRTPAVAALFVVLHSV